MTWTKGLPMTDQMDLESVFSVAQIHRHLTPLDAADDAAGAPPAT